MNARLKELLRNASWQTPLAIIAWMTKRPHAEIVSLSPSLHHCNWTVVYYYACGYRWLWFPHTASPVVKLRVLFSTLINDWSNPYNGTSFVINVFQRLFLRKRLPPLWTLISPHFCWCFRFSSAPVFSSVTTVLPLPGSTLTILFLLVISIFIMYCLHDIRPLQKALHKWLNMINIYPNH